MYIHTKTPVQIIEEEKNSLTNQVEKLNLELIHICLIKTYQFLENNFKNCTISVMQINNNLSFLVHDSKNKKSNNAIELGLQISKNCWDVSPGTIAQFFEYYEGGVLEFSFKNTDKNRLINISHFLGNGENAKRWLNRVHTYMEKDKLENNVNKKLSFQKINPKI